LKNRHHTFALKGQYIYESINYIAIEILAKAALYLKSPPDLKVGAIQVGAIQVGAIQKHKKAVISMENG
jgi:hypothetical protein